MGNGLLKWYSVLVEFCFVTQLDIFHGFLKMNSFAHMPFISLCVFIIADFEMGYLLICWKERI